MNIVDAFALVTGAGHGIAQLRCDALPAELAHKVYAAPCGPASVGLPGVPLTARGALVLVLSGDGGGAIVDMLPVLGLLGLPTAASCEKAPAGRFDAQTVHALPTPAGDTIVKAPEPRPEAKPLLSERETAVLRRLSLGESNKEAARKLQISPSTVRTHVENIFRKLGCTTRTAASLKAHHLGMI